MSLNTLKFITVSHGTHRPVDLICTFANTLRNVSDMGPIAYSVYAAATQTFRLLHILEEKHLNPSARLHERANDNINELIDVLNIYAPEDFYFGTHPADGACFGFWPIDDDLWPTEDDDF